MNARFFEPMLCLAVPKLAEGPEWQLELRLDGYPGIEIKSNSGAHLASRNVENLVSDTRLPRESSIVF